MKERVWFGRKELYYVMGGSIGVTRDRFLVLSVMMDCR